MDLDTDYRRRMLALQQSNPSLRTAATVQDATTLKPITSANLPAPVTKVIQPTQKPSVQQNTPEYTIQQRNDKGYDFFGPGNKKINIEDYVKATGANQNELIKGMASRGDTVSQQTISKNPAAFGETVQPQKDNSILGFLKSIPDQAGKFAGGMGNLIRTIGGSIFGGATDTGSRVIETLDQAKTAIDRGIDNINPSLTPEQRSANILRDSIRFKGYDDFRAAASDITNAIAGTDINIKAETDREAKAISSGNATPGEVFSAALKSLDLASIVPAAKLITAAKVASPEIIDSSVVSIQKSIGRELTETEKSKVSSEISKQLDNVSKDQPMAIPQEDIDAIKAAGGNVPETSVNPVTTTSVLPESDIQAIKEAGGTPPASTIADTLPGSKVSETADTVFHLPSLGVHTKLTKDQAEILKDEINNIPWTKADRPHLTAGDKVLSNTKEITPEELANLSPNAKQALDNANKQIEVNRAQTGISDTPVEGTPKMTSPDIAQADVSAKAVDNVANDVKPAVEADIAPGAKTSNDGIKFRDPETKKQITRSYDDVETELNALKTLDSPTPAQLADIKSYTTKLAKYRSQNAKYAFPDATPEDQKAVQQIMDQLAPAERNANKKLKTTAQDKAARITKGEKSYSSAGGGEEGFRAKLSNLKGKYQDGKYEPISVDKKTEKQLLDSIEKSDLRPFEKLNTQNALRKIWGANPEKPTASDVTYIRKFFNKEHGDGVGDDLADGINEALKSGQSWEDIASNIAGLPRALMATGDLSGGFRQALPLGTRFPSLWANANKESVRYALNPKYYEKELKKIIDSDSYSAITDKLGVDLPGAGAIADEGFIGAGYAEKIPLAKIGIKAADRAYTGVLTKLRYDVANKLIDEAGGVDKYLKNTDELYGPKADDAMRALGEVINTFTGRGGKKGGLLDEHMKTASTLLFAPRLWAANLQRLNPAFYVRLAKTNPQAAKLALQSQGTFLATAGTVLGLAAAAGASVGLDPKSADFGKIRVGNTRYDILGGQQQNIVLLSRLITGQKTNSETGETVTVGEGYGAKTRMDLVTDMINNKSNPLLGFGIKLMNSSPQADGSLKDQYGQDLNVPEQFMKLGIPLGIQGAVDTSIDVGDPVKGVLMNAPSFFGVGVQTYGNVKSKDKAIGEDGKISFKGKIEPDMVVDKDGNAVIDKNGVVVRVKIDKNSTPAEIKALKDEKLRSTLRDNFVNSQSKEDQALMKLSEDELSDFVKDKTITQEKADKIASLNAQAKSQSDKPDPDITSDEAKSFYSTWNSKSKKEQDDWLQSTPDDTAKKIATRVNSERVSGLSEFKASNELSKLYSEYEKDINSHPEYTKIDKQNKSKAFQSSAAKLNYSVDQRDIYSEGGSDDLKALISDGQVSKTDLDNAINLDNELYNSGLSSSLKFSKKFRTEYGYGSPAKAGGSGKSSMNIASYLPSKSSSGGGAKPEFSSRPRGKKISFKTNLPSKSSKKIQIKL